MRPLSANDISSWVAAVGVVLAAASIAPSVSGAELIPYEVSGDAVRQPLGGLIGDPARGREIVLDRGRGNCLICHSIPSLEEPFQGVLGPSLGKVGSRLSTGQIRLRMIDQSRINAGTIMPPFYRVRNLRDVALAYRGKPALDAQQIEDVVAFLATLTE